MALIQRKTKKEGEIFNKWLYSRLIRQNKNVLSAELGATGSGKSYRDLRKAELWYLYYFKEKFPIDNICFGIPKMMEVLASGKLRKGDIIIGEEAGVNLGSRSWQSKMSKMFNYVLQSFRSMNVGIFFNLPYLSMLDSQARHLLHYYAESVGIDQEKQTNKCKPFFVQVAQSTGKVYRHYPSIKIDGRIKKVKRFSFKLPSQYLIDAYEEKKENYLKELIKGYSDTVNTNTKTTKQDNLVFKIDFFRSEGLPMRNIAEKLGISYTKVNYIIKQEGLNSNRSNKYHIARDVPKISIKKELE